MKKLSVNKAKILSSVIISFILVIIFSLVIRLVFSQLSGKMFDQYDENCVMVAETCARTIEGHLETRKSILDNFISKFNGRSEEEAVKYLQAPVNKQIFNNIYYLNSDGISYSYDGKKADFSSKDFFVNRPREKLKDLDFYFITNPISFSFYDDKDISIKDKYAVILGRPFKLDNGKISFICSSVSLRKMEESYFLFSNLDSKKIRVTLLDEEGRFMVNQEYPEMIMKAYVPQKRSMAHTASGMVIHNPGKVYNIVWDLSGQESDLVVTPVKGTPWFVSVVISKDEINKLKGLTSATAWMIFGSLLIFVFLLLTLENHVLKVFQKKKLLSSYYDNLTNLWTRVKFEKECSLLLKHNADSQFLLIEADILGFKFINQNHGTIAADKLLYFFSEVLNIFARKYKGMCARGYADHFYLFFKVNNQDSAMEVIKTGIKELHSTIRGYELPFTPKLGLAFYNRKKCEDTIQSLTGKASFARSTIRDNAMADYAIYDEELQRQANEERFLEQNMEQALANNEFFVMYQPKINLKTEKIVGAEALVRWNNPKLGILSPVKFIPLFERNRFVKKLDFYVYESVFKFIQNRLEKNLPVVPVSVNMSRIHTKPAVFVEEFMTIFNKYKVDPKYIEVEILERSVVQDNTLLEITNLLHENGFKVAMDDFGSGESSLNMLTKIPVDILKFDREFLLSSANESGEYDEKNEHFIKTLLDLSKNLDKSTIFEGVETEVQRDFLKRVNCDQVQGFFYSKPLLEEDFLKFMEEHI